MAINSDEKQNDSNNWKITTISRKPTSCNNESLVSSASSRSKRNTKSMVSPYLYNDKVQLHSKPSEKKTVNRHTDYMSSFPLAAKIYKANSDEFKIPKRATKKAKKCVHTLPNNPALLPQACTVSDMNDSEYNETKNSRKLKPKLKKRRGNKKPSIPDKNIEIYDRDARYCSQLNINLDSSSTDMFKHLTGDGRKILRKPKNLFGRNQVIDNDVWAVLRNINKIQFIPSPPMSTNSIESLKKKKSSRKRPSDRTDTSYIETCRTEEFAYISYENTSLHSNSRSSSFDRVTVIGRQDKVKTNYAQIISNEPMQKFGLLANQKRKRISRINTNSNKTDLIDNKERQQQQKSKIQTYESPSQSKDINNDTHVANMNKSGTTEKTFCVAEIKSSMTKMLSVKTELDKSSLTSVPEQKEQLNGITRVVLSKGRDAVNVNNSKQQGATRKPRLVTTILSTDITKLTQAEIKRRLAKIKYPLIVTGKDQVSSGIQIVDYETPQFYGLDNQIWPFMLKWLPEFQSENNQCNFKKERVSITSQKDNSSVLGENEISMEKRYINPDVHLHKKATSFQMKSKTVKNYDLSIDLDLTKSKGKHLRQFRDKMVNLVCNKSSNFQNKQNHNTKYRSVEVPSKHVNTETQTYCNKSVSRKDSSVYLPTANLVEDHLKTKAKHTWSKRKWASDFIENIIRKVKSGVYYGQEYHRNLGAESKYTQTETFINNINIIDKVVVFKEENDIFDDLFDYEAIPGFEDTIQGLELKTVNKNQITIKHCDTNITVHFDVAFPLETNGALQKQESLSDFPIEVTERRVYKCKAIIENAVLPAELCSILPKMLNNIYDSNILSFLPKPFDKLDCYSLLPIKEITQYECYDFNNRSSAQISSISNNLISKSGRFSHIIKHDDIERKPFNFDVAGFSTPMQLLPELKLETLFDNFSTYLPITLRISSINRPIEFDKFEDIFVKPTKTNTCSAIVPYIPKQCMITDFTKPRREFSYVEAKNTTFIYFNLESMNPFKLECFGTRTVISLLSNAKSQISFDVDKTNVDLLYKHSGGNVIMNDDISTLFSEEKHCNDYYLEGKKQLMFKSGNAGLIINKLNRNRRARLNKKCKSTSSISYNKSTPLQRIANLDEFFQALGSAKNLAGVIDGNAERKILSSIVEMKSWITDMTPRQALLILLLANKTETSNLIRFRNVILQGIAMNRITKASELEMEIEVIERETLNTSPHFEGISYVPASIENQDNLLEELCWIAKTTASDYKKPFDRSSERLLKSLLSKRKKLNPSYLRVMARYVGLGLLKAK